ncbi:MAG: hypothetical protein HY763_06300 [Planctomycetes bacterium]|nr:hypothetical protein [Planctomycetota bacterium]
MNMLARKISRAKWERKPHLAPNEIGADAITACLRTSGDALSWWRCADEEEDVARVALAVALPVDKDKQKLETIDVALVPAVELESIGLSLRDSEGNTLVNDVRARHVDVVYFDVDRLAAVARMLAPRIRSGTQVFTFTSARVKRLFREAIGDNRVDPSALSDKILAKLDIEASH